MILRLVFVTALLLTGLAHRDGVLAQTDPEKLYQLRCRTCHAGPSAGFVRVQMRLENQAVVVSSTGKPISELMRNHHGLKLGDKDVSALEALFATHLGPTRPQ
jgi:hypothetical protein